MRVGTIYAGVFVTDCDEETLKYRATRACRVNMDDNINAVGPLMD